MHCSLSFQKHFAFICPAFPQTKQVRTFFFTLLELSCLGWYWIPDFIWEWDGFELWNGIFAVISMSCSNWYRLWLNIVCRFRNSMKMFVWLKDSCITNCSYRLVRPFRMIASKNVIEIRSPAWSSRVINFCALMRFIVKVHRLPAVTFPIVACNSLLLSFPCSEIVFSKVSRLVVHHQFLSRQRMLDWITEPLRSGFAHKINSQKSLLMLTFTYRTLWWKCH